MGADLLGIAVSGLKTSQAQLGAAGQNITHANEEGYTRQRVEVGTNPALFSGSGFIGTGVNVQSIDRLANEFVITQIRLDTTAFNELDAFSQKIGELDNLLANESIGLSSGLAEFFSSMQAATDDPTSIPVRQLVLAQADVLAQRFGALYGRFGEINNIVSQELDATAGQISALASSLSNLNESIVNAVGQGSGNTPNDLLDERDETLRQLSELVAITTFEQSDGAINVFIGNGQPLVVGTTVNEVRAVPGQTDATRTDIAFVNNDSIQVITDEIRGGRMGGLLDFRNDVLDRSFNELGRIALTFTEAMNAQQQLGLDLNGNFGEPIFDPINSRQAQLDRVSPSQTNAAPPDRLVSVEILDPTILSNSDYELRLSGSGPDAYELVRLTDDTVVQAGGLPAQRPTSFEAEGFRVTFETGSFADGDRFTIMPTRFGANNVDVIATSPEILAFAQPVTTANSLSNTGTGSISQGETLQTIDPATGELMPAFENLGQLSPPLMVRFTSETTYDVLDATDPANPKSLNPPLENLQFKPGERNQILPSEPGQTVVASDGANAGRIPRLSEVVSGPIGTEAQNTYLDENISIALTDPNTGIVTTQPFVQVQRGDSAEQIAFQLGSRDGVSATASTEIKINVNDDGLATGTDFNLYLNDINLGDTLAQSLNLAQPPRPLTNDSIAQAINASGVLQAQGISAVSDGDMITITAATGADLRFQVEGDTATDFIEVKGDDPATLWGTTNVTGTVDLATGGPYSFDVDIFDGPNGLSNPKTIDLQGVFNDPDDLVSYLQNQIDRAYDISGKVEVSLNADGTLAFSTVSTNTDAQIQLSNLVGGDPLGINTAVGQGVMTPTDLLLVDGAGVAGIVNSTTIGGTVNVTLEENYSLTSSATVNGNVFTTNPTAVSNFFGYTFDITGNPNGGDEFFVNFNTDGVSDNRNALKFVEIEAAQLINGNASFQESYGDLVEFVGTVTAEANINRDAADEILGQSRELRNSISGVNLDEEAADLIRFEQAYNASSRIITVARDLFNTLLQSF
jgi:flagellar hook-associated protein 1